MRKYLVSFLTIGLVLTAGCSTYQAHDLDTTKPVDVDEIGIVIKDARLQQDGEPIYYWDAVKKFSSDSESHWAAHESESYFWSAVGSYSIATGFFVAGLTQKENIGLDYGIAAGFVALSFGFEYLQNNAFEKAALIYNKKFPAKSIKSKVTDPDSESQILPFFIPLASGGALTGINITF